jgi:hypothetical protein
MEEVSKDPMRQSLTFCYARGQLDPHAPQLTHEASACAAPFTNIPSYYLKISHKKLPGRDGHPLK